MLTHDELVLRFDSIIQSVLDYGATVFMNCGVCLNARMLRLCKRAFRIIHNFDVKICDKCNILDIEHRRISLALKLYKTAIFSDNHVLHHLLPPFSCRSNRLILPHCRTARRAESFVFYCSQLYNEGL